MWYDGLMGGDMPYMLVHRDNQYHVYKRGADGRAEGRRLGTHGSSSAAQRQLSALYAAEESGGKKMERYADLDLYPPVEVTRSAREALKMAAKHGYTLPPVTTGLAFRSSCTPRTIRAMCKFFDRIDDVQKAAWKPESPERCAYLCYGGDVGRAWAAKMLKEIELVESRPASKGLSINGDMWAAVKPDFTTKYQAGDLVYVRSAGGRGEVVSVNRTKVGVVYGVKLDLGGMLVCRTKDLQRVATRAAKLEVDVPEAVRAAILRLAQRKIAQVVEEPPPAQKPVEVPAQEDAEQSVVPASSEAGAPPSFNDGLRRAAVKAIQWAILANDAQTAAELAKNVPAGSGDEQIALEYVIEAVAQNNDYWADTAMLLYERAFGAPETQTGE